MTEQEKQLYTQTMKRLIRLGKNRPDEAILFLADEVKYYRAKIRRMGEVLEDCFEENKTLREQNRALAAGFDTVKADIVQEMQKRLKEHIASLEYKAKSTRKTIEFDRLCEQVDWVLHEIVPATIDEVAAIMLLRGD